MCKNRFLNINFEFSKSNIFKRLDDHIDNKKKGYICVVDGNVAIEANKHKEYLSILDKSIFNICDGSWLAMAHSFISKNKVEAYPGPDFFIDIIKEKKYKQYFLGSSNELLNALKSGLTKIDEQISGMVFTSPPFLPVDQFNYKEIAEQINIEKPEIIWIALGAPKQEVFMEKLLLYINTGVMVGVGAAFTFYSGYKNFKRAPKLYRNLKLEWFYRFFQEPKKQGKRIVRGLIYLPFLTIKEYFKS